MQNLNKTYLQQYFNSLIENRTSYPAIYFISLELNTVSYRKILFSFLKYFATYLVFKLRFAIFNCHKL